MEILVVIALIGTLAGIVIANLDSILGGNQEQIAQTFVDNSLDTPLMMYRTNMGGYPTEEQGGLNALLKAPASAEKKWKGPYIKNAPLDPWGTPYQFKSPGTHNPGSYDIWSLGPDKKEGGGDDIGNW